MMVQVDRALSICARKTGYLQCWQSGVQQTNGERARAVGTDHERLFDVGGFRWTGDENPENRVGKLGPAFFRGGGDSRGRGVPVFDDRGGRPHQNEELAKEIV